MSGPTKFIEANAILAAQSGDDEAVEEAILKLYPAERRDLRRAAFKLIQALNQYENHAVKEATDV